MSNKTKFNILFLLCFSIIIAWRSYVIVIGQKLTANKIDLPGAGGTATDCVDWLKENRTETLLTRLPSRPTNKLLPKQGEVFLIGSRMMSTELGDLSDATNKSFLNMSFNFKYDDPKDPEQFFYRSDHFNYAHKGVPIIFYMDGNHADYHQPSDSIEKIDFANMEKIARTIFSDRLETRKPPDASES